VPARFAPKPAISKYSPDGTTASEGQAVRVAPCLIVAASLGLSLVGCSSTNRRQGNGSDGVFLGAGPQPAANKKAESADPIVNTAGPQPEIEGMLAGYVLDGATGRPVSASIRCTCLDDPKAEEAPVSTDARGNYTIQGLKSGKRYKLVAKSRQEGRNLVGVKYTLAPNPVANIKLQEEASPPAEGGAPPPAPPGGKAPEKPAEPEKKTGALPTPERPASAQVPVPAWGPSVGTVPVPGAGGSPGIGIRQPVPLAPQQTPAAGDAPGWGRSPVPPLAPQRIAQEQDGPRPTRMPVMDWKNRSQPDPAPESPARVPSACVVGKRVVNFALFDVGGQPWEYRRDRRGKLVLLDFWSTTCPPCLKTIPALRQLKETYGPTGLEVVAIAYEHSGTPAEQAQRVSATAQRLGMNCKLLLGSGAQCEVKTQFRVQAYPTLILLDENGDMVWYLTGQPETYQLGELERTIRMKLNLNRPLNIN
jgi:thiol-disulfide isomerase/thioredoxin